MDEISDTHKQPYLSRAGSPRLRSGFVSVTRLQALAFFFLLIAVVAIRWNRLGGSSLGAIVGTAAYSFAFGQLMLAAVATVFGPWNLVSRLTIPPLLIWLQLGVSMVIFDSTLRTPWAILHSSLGIGLWAIAQLPLWTYRSFTGHRLTAVGFAPAEMDNKFNIGQLLYLTFIVAVLLSIGRLVLSAELVRDFYSFRPKSTLVFALIGTAVTATTLLAVKATLLNRRGWAEFGWLTLAVCFVVASLFTAVHRLDPPGMRGPGEKLMLAASVFGQYLWIVINLYALRAAGWRLAPSSMVHTSVNCRLQLPE